MNDILNVNQNIFGSKFSTKRVSRRARKAMAEPLTIPDCAVEMTYDDMCEVNGGGYIRLGVKFTIGGFVGASVVASIVGYLSGYCVTKAVKFGSMIGGFWGGVVGLAVGALVSWGISSAVNNAVYSSTGGPQEITLININTGIFGGSDSYYYDLGKLLGIVVGGGMGFGAAYALGTSHALATA